MTQQDILYQTSFAGARSITLQSPYTITTTPVPDSQYALSSITMDDKKTIWFGDKVEIDVVFKEQDIFPTYYIANYMYKAQTREVQINEFEENDSSIFVLPSLTLPKHTVVYNSNFINAYLSHYNYKSNIC